MTIENPLSRTYTDVPLSDLGRLVYTFGGRKIDAAGPRTIQVTPGSVRGLGARRFRLIYASNEFVDIWTTSALGPTPQFRTVVDRFAREISPKTAAALRAIPGTPLYVELNIGRYRKVAILFPKRIAFNRAGEEKSLRVSPFMFRAPFGTIFK